MMEVGRRVWRTLAPKAVRQAAGRATGALVFENTVRTLRARRGVKGEGPPALVGFFSNSSGVAASAQLASRALDRLGVAHRQIDVGDVAEPNDPGDRSASAWVFYVNPPELMQLLSRWRARDLQGLRFGHWAWELPRAPASWRKAADAMDGVMAQSRFTADAFAPKLVSIVPHPLFQNGLTSQSRSAEKIFRVVTIFDFKSSFARKNPIGAIHAFHRAFGDNPSVELLVKTQNANAAPDLAQKLQERTGSNVQMVDGVWDRARVMDLIASADVLISLHRAEGFGLTLAEAMLTGVPVVATNWSGNRDFMDDTTACLVPSKTIPIEDSQGIYGGQEWADPDIAIAAQHLRRLHDDPVFADALARRARENVSRHLAPEAWFQSLPINLRTALSESTLT